VIIVRVTASLGLAGIVGIIILAGLFLKVLPTASLQPGNYTAVIYPTDDSYVYKASSSSNYGTQYYIYSTGYTQEKIGYLKFDISSLPESAKIRSAKLYLYVNYVYRSYAANVTKIYSVDDNSWTETSITYNNRPPATKLLDTKQVTSYRYWQDWDITQQASEDLQSDKVVNLAVKSEPRENYKNWYYYVRFASKDYTYGAYTPYLKIEYEITEQEIPQPPTTQLPITNVLNQIWQSIAGS
jgi:hypothetical protein